MSKPEDIQFRTRLPEALYRLILAEASQNFRSLPSEIEFRLTASLGLDQSELNRLAEAVRKRGEG